MRRYLDLLTDAFMLRVFYGVTTLDRYLPGGDYLPAQGAVVRQVASK